MREIQLHPPVKRKPYPVVRRLQFFSNGAELVAWVGTERVIRAGRVGYTERFYTCAPARDTLPELHDNWFNTDFDPSPDPVISPDRKLIVYEYGGDYEDGYLNFDWVVAPEAESGALPHLRSCPAGLGGFSFTPDGTELIAVRNIYEISSGHGVPCTPDVVRFELASLQKPPVRYEEKTNPFTRAPYRAPVYDVCWLPVMDLPHDKVVTVALSGDGTLLATGSAGAAVHVANLMDRTVVASFPWQGRDLHDHKPMRVDFDPAAQWVTMLANGRLFARPLGAGAAWRTKRTLGYVHDFAYHPSGRVLCAVFRDGLARYIDPHTGKVLETFRWSKKPKPLYSVAFAPDGLTCAAGGENGRVILWDVDV